MDLKCPNKEEKKTRSDPRYNRTSSYQLTWRWLLWTQLDLLYKGGNKQTEKEIGVSVVFEHFTYKFGKTFTTRWKKTNLCLSHHECSRVRYGRYGGYWYRFGIDMGDIGIGNPVSYRVFKCNICIIYLYQNRYEPGIGIIPIYRFDMGDFGDIGIGISVSVEL